jgi:ribonuclease HI
LAETAGFVGHDWSIERHDENALIIYTDGSCKPNPRRGGYAFVILSEDENGEELLIERNPAGRRGATNIEMELTACIEALRLVTNQHPPVPKSSYRKIVIYADLALISENIYAAENVWPDRDWLTRENEPVINADLWEELVRLKRKAGHVEIRHVKGHGKNPYNNRADELARESADAALLEQRVPKQVGRKRSSRQTEARVIPMQGQMEVIRIIVVRPIPGRPHHAYKYEVVREDSPHFGAVDDAFATNEIAMRRAHIYEVRFAEADRRGRWIEEVVREIERD